MVQSAEMIRESIGLIGAHVLRVQLPFDARSRRSPGGLVAEG
jgi:hypothetical protein